MDMSDGTTRSKHEEHKTEASIFLETNKLVFVNSGQSIWHKRHLAYPCRVLTHTIDSSLLAVDVADDITSIGWAKVESSESTTLFPHDSVLELWSESCTGGRRTGNRRTSWAVRVTWILNSLRTSLNLFWIWSIPNSFSKNSRALRISLSLSEICEAILDIWLLVFSMHLFSCKSGVLTSANVPKNAWRGANGDWGLDDDEFELLDMTKFFFD